MSSLISFGKKAKPSKDYRGGICEALRKFEGLLFVFISLLLIFPAASNIGYARQPTPGVKITSYTIKSIPFNAFEVTSDISQIRVVFSRYGEKVTVLYPAPEENIIRDTATISKKCNEALLQNAGKIVKIQKENKSVNKYLTFDNKLPALGKEDFLSIIDNPQEMTFQRDPGINKSIAEFRSKEFEVNKNTAFCIYITFICTPEKGTVEKIIISGVKLEE